MTRAHYFWLPWLQQQIKQKRTMLCLIDSASTVQAGKLRHRDRAGELGNGLSRRPQLNRHAHWGGHFGDMDYFYNGGFQTTHVPRRVFVMATSGVICLHSQLEGGRTARHLTTWLAKGGRDGPLLCSASPGVSSQPCSLMGGGVSLHQLPRLPSQKETEFELEGSLCFHHPGRFLGIWRSCCVASANWPNLSVPELTRLENSRSHRA